MTDLRLLTVKQPHAWAIIAGLKDVENRTWRLPLPMGSTLAIHAGVKPAEAGFPVPVEPPAELIRGAVIGFVDVIDDHDWTDCTRLGSTGRRFCSPWAAPHHRHWVLDNARPLNEPIPARGRLWVHRPPPDLAERLALALWGE